MKKSLVDVPVKFNIWIRPELQKNQFDIIKKARPSILFIQSDGGRNIDEWNAINKNRKMIEDGIDWECKVYKIYEDKNLGMYSMGGKVEKIVWANVDRCIFLEDDQMPSVSFFRFCAELLEKYKDDQRIECICGMNHELISKDVSSDYFFSREGSIWGIATWKRVYLEYRDFSYSRDPYTLKILKNYTSHDRELWESILGYGEGRYHEGHVAGVEFYTVFDVYAKHRLQIIPRVNLISNMGADNNAAHSNELKKLPHGIRKVFNMQRYELDFPLTHPRYIIPDLDYERRRNRIMAKGYPLIKLIRNFEKALLIFYYDGPSALVKRLSKYINIQLKSKDRIES